jgi:hypothetical protein
MGVYERPVVDRQIDDDQARRWQLLAELFAQFHIARRDQLQREIVEAWIMADDDQGVRLARFADHADQRFGTGVVESLIADWARRLGESLGDQRLSLLGPFCR